MSDSTIPAPKLRFKESVLFNKPASSPRAAESFHIMFVAR
jgi:hypothetical protein